MRWSRTTALAVTLLVLLPAALHAAPIPNPGAGIAGVRGRSVVPRVVTLESLPHRTAPYTGSVRERAEAHYPEVDAELARLKQSPLPLTPAELGNVTLDPNAGGFTPLAPTIGTGFEGITQGPYIPSEPTCAAGPLNIFSAGNVSVTVANKDGSNRVETDGQVFFGVPGAEGAISDAQCYYDALRGRFVALCFTQGASPSNYSYFYLAISQTNDARGAWYIYKFDMTLDGTTPTSNWADYEGLGVSDDKIAMSSQQFSFAGDIYKYQKIRVIDRAIAYTGAPVTYVDFYNFAAPPGGNSNDNFVTKPARNLSAGDNTIHLLCVRTNGGTRVTYRTVTGAPSSPALSAGNLVTVGSYSPPPDAVQKGSATLVATNDCRPTDFYVRDGVLICAWHTSASFGGTVSALRLFRMRTSDRVVLTDETYGATGTFYYYPAVTVDSVGTIFLGFDRSSSTEYPSCYATGKRRSDATLEPSALLKAGLSATAQSRWGDYTGIDQDYSQFGPSNSTAWYAGQWTKGTNTFGTWINKLTFTYGVIAGSVLDDCDGSAGTTGDRSALAGVSLALKQGATTLATTTTDSSGNYSFGYLESGTYDVVVTPPAGGTAVDAIPGSGGTSQTRISASDLQLVLTNAQTSSSNQFLVTSTHAAPLTSGIAPNTKNAGDPTFPMTVNGSNFVRCAVVRLDGSDRATAWVSGSQLTATIPASDMAAGGTHAITVFNPAPGGGTSNSQTFTVTGGDVTPPVVTVTAPNGGETWKAGSSHAITWSATDAVSVTAVDIAWSSDGGATFPNAVATGIANSGSFAWAVPDAPTASARVRVIARDAAGNAGRDSSDANFTIDRWVITASAGTNGSIAPSGAVGVIQGASQGFTITPDPCYHVADLLVDGGSVGAVTSYNFPNVTANHTIAASFARDTLTITASAGANGGITPSGAVPVSCGASQAFTIAPDPGYHVADVLVDGGSVGAVTGYNFPNVTVNHTIAASFALNTYTITASAGAGGGIAPSGAVPVSHGASQGFTIAPDTCYRVVDVLVDGGSVGAVTSYNFPNVTANHTIAASFARDTLTITASAGANGGITPSGAVPVSCGASQAFTVAPDPGYHVADLLVDGGSVGAVTGYNFPNVMVNHTIAASFAIDTHTLTVTVAGGGSVTRAPNLVSYDHGASVQLTAVPDSGWAFTGWSGDTSGAGNPITLVMTADKAVTATFADTAGPALLVVAPNGGELLGIGSTATLSWTATDNVAVTAVDLFLSRAGAAGPYDSLATGLGNSGSYGWTVTGPATTDAFLKVIAHDAAGNARFDLSDAAFTITSGVGVESGAVTDFELAPVWPNPLRGSGRIGFAVPRACGVRLSVLDIQGREVAVLADGAYAPGRHHVAWDAASRGGAQPGLYFVRLRVPGRVLVRRVVMTR